MTLQPGDLIDGKYRIVRLIGEGGMGAVYEGENTRIHRKVAIKVLHAEVAQMADVVARFEREAQAAGHIGSEHIVEVLDLGTLASGDRYIVMEFMEGESLSQRIRTRQKLPPREAYTIIHQTLEALGAAHTAGIVHRDVKPDNIFLQRTKKAGSDFVKVLDFGISKFSGSTAALSLTRTGAVMGTPYYMAPEQAKGSREFDHRVDLYSLGIVLYEALTGQVPFQAETFNQLLFKIVLEEPRPIEELAPELDAQLIAIVKKGMAREPAHRYQTAAEFQAALDEWANGAGATAGASAAQLPNRPDATAPAPAPRALAMTPGNWSGNGSGADETQLAPKKTGGKVGLIAGGAVAFLALAAGAAFMLAPKKEAPADAAPLGDATAAAAAPPASPTTPTAAPSEATPAPTAAAASAGAPAITPEATPSAAASVAAGAPQAARAVAAPIRRAGPAPAPEKKKDAAPAGAGTSGRKYRTSL